MINLNFKTDNPYAYQEEKKDSFIVFKNVDNGKIGEGSGPTQIDYAKYYANESAADSKRTYSQIMDLEKYLKEINEGENKYKDRKDNRSKTAALQDPISANLRDRSKTQNISEPTQQAAGFYANKYEKDVRVGRTLDNPEKKPPKLDRARTKEPYSKDKNEDSEKFLRRKRDLDKFLGDDDYSGARLSKMSMKNRQINETYNKKLVEETPKVVI